VSASPVENESEFYPVRSSSLAGQGSSELDALHLRASKTHVGDGKACLFDS
jgi:hypothetical protein